MIRAIAAAALCITASALIAQRSPATTAGSPATTAATDDALVALRRAMAQKPAVSRKSFGAASVAAAVSAFANVAAVDASGGATAGGAYLLRAKERYNARVLAGAKGAVVPERAPRPPSPPSDVEIFQGEFDSDEEVAFRPPSPKGFFCSSSSFCSLRRESLVSLRRAGPRPCRSSAP